MNLREWLKNNKEKIYNKVIFIIEMLIALILGISIYKVSYKYQDFRYISRPHLTIAILSCISLLIIIIFNTKKYKKTIEKLFLTYVIPIGIMFIILLPMCLVPDEEGHIFKSYEISMGKLITPLGEKNEGDIYVPKQVLEIAQKKDSMNYSQIHMLLQQETDYDDLTPVQTPAKTYFPINYLTGAMTFAVCRGLNINVLLACYLARLVNFIMFIIIGYYSIKILPFGKLLLAIYMSLPMGIQQAASLSADAFINSISILFIAYNLKLLYQEKDLELKQKIIYYVLALSISLCKYVYFPLVFMSLLLIKNKNISKKNKIQITVITIITSIIVAIIWFAFSQQYVDTRLYIKQANVNTMEQMKYVLKNPLKYVKVLINTLQAYGGYYLLSFVGSNLGSANIEIPQICSLALLFGLCIIPFFEKNKKSFEKIEKWIMLFIAMILILLVETGLYLTWSPLQYNLVAGVQGRYFIPIFILILLAMINKDKNIEIKNLEMKYFIVYFTLNIISLLTIYTNFVQ